MSLPTFRPRSATELVDAAMQLGRRHFAPLITLSAIVAVPNLIVGLLFMRAMPAPTITAEPDFGVIASLLPALLVTLCWLYVGLGALIASAASAYVDGHALPPVEAMKRALRRAHVLIAGTLAASVLVTVVVFAAVFALMMALGIIGALIGMAVGGGAGALTTGLGVAVGLAVTAATTALMIAGFLFGSSYFVNVPAVIMLEGLGPFAAIGRSRTLVRGSLRRVTGVVGILLVLYLVAYLTLLAIGGAIARDVQMASNVAGVFVVVLYPFLAALLAVLYFDLRIRREGYDIELLARALGEAPGESASPGGGEPGLPGEGARA